MLRKFSLRLPVDLYEDLREEALRERISLSDVIREDVFRSRKSKGELPQISKIHSNLQEESSTILTLLSQRENLNQENHLMIVETLSLFREFLFERNGQILKKVDEKMEKRFGKERKKIL